LTEVGADEGHLRTLRAETVHQIEVVEPRSAGRLALARDAVELETGGARLGDRQDPLDHLLPASEVIVLSRGRLVLTREPRATEVGAVALVDDTAVDEDELALAHDAVGRAG